MSNTTSPARLSRFPSKISPTTRPFASTIGEPELPPMMSFVVTKLNGVAWLSRARAPSHDFGSSNDGSPARDSARVNVPPSVVNAGTAVPSSVVHPLTVP